MNWGKIMILDLICIITSYCIKNLNNTLSQKIQKLLYGRYLNLYEDTTPKINKLYSTFSDYEAMEKVLSDAKAL